MTAFEDFLMDLHETLVHDDLTAPDAIIATIVDMAPSYAFGIEAGGAGVHVAVRTETLAGAEVDFDAADNAVAARLTDCSQVHLV